MIENCVAPLDAPPRPAGEPAALKAGLAAIFARVLRRPMSARRMISSTLAASPFWP